MSILKSCLVYAALDQEEQTIKNVAFKFVDDRSLMQALIRTVEGSIRAYVATREAAENIFAEVRDRNQCKRTPDDTRKDGDIWSIYN